MFKQSIYNYFIPHDDKVVYFNGITCHSFSLSKKENERIQNLLKDPISFEISYSSVFKKFVDWGFMVDDSVDEVDIIRFRHRMATMENRDYHLVINPTLECNFNCWYCYQEHPKGYMDTTTMEKVKRHLYYMVQTKRITGLNLSWFGGEPLLYFNQVVDPISLYAKELCEKHQLPYHCSITTNAYKINKPMIERMKAIGMTSFQITLDGGPKRHNKIRNEKGMPSFETILQNINLLCENIDKVRINLRINYDDATLNDKTLLSVFERIDSKFRTLIRPNFQRVWQTVKKVEHENIQRLELFNLCKTMGYAINEPANVFTIGIHNKCYADRYYHAEINCDGKVYSCTARGYSDKHVFGHLEDSGELVWDNKKITEKLAKATFENEMCLACKYLPLCLGPCSQKKMETPHDQLQNICSLNISEIKPETAIISFHNSKKLVK